MTAHAPTGADRAAATCFAATYVGTVLAAFWPGLPLILPATGLIVYLMLAVRRIRRLQALVGGGFAVTGAGLAWAGAGTGGLADLALAASRHTLPLLLLFGAVAWLHHAVRTESRFTSLGDAIAGLPPARRVVAIGLSSHFLGGVLSLAGLGLVTSIPSRQSTAPRLKLTAQAAVRGFNTAACWSPFFVGMAAALTAVSVRWTDVVSDGVVLAVLLLGLAWLWEWRRPVQVPAATPPPGPLPHLGQITLTLAAVALPVIALHEGAGLTIPVAIALACPVAAVGISGRASPSGVIPVGLAVWHHLPLLATEIFVLFSANVFAVGLLAHTGPILAWLDALPGDVAAGAWGPGAVIMAGTAIAGLGIHPLVVITFVAGAMPHGLPGTSAASTALALAVVWGLGTMISPISAVNMMLARMTGVSPLRIAWVWNGAFGLVAAALAAVVVTLVVWLRGTA